jgi:alpha-tubulin suppressor-like RCC1 family protein
MFHYGKKGGRPMIRRTIVGLISTFLMISVLIWHEPIRATEETTQHTDSIGSRQLEAGGESSFYIDEYSVLWAWGDNRNGQLGDGTTTVRRTPIKVMENVVKVTTGYYHTLAIKTDGSLWAWGSNENGRLGDGTTTDRLTPVKVMVLENVVSVSAGYAHTLAIEADGSLWAWGFNGIGQLGDGNTTDRYTPFKVMENVVSISAGYAHTVATKTDGSLWTWGRNMNGELGNGTTEDSYVPLKVMENVDSVSAGGMHNLAIKTDGSLWVWGYNEYGQLGDGNFVSRLTPFKVMENVVSVSAGNFHTLAIKTDGSLWAWGNNNSGRLGDGTTINRRWPVKVMENVVYVTAGYAHTLAIETDGSLWAWGFNYFGQLGNGSDGLSDTPIPVVIEYDNVSAITVNTLPIKTSYLFGESLNLEGVTLKITLTDGTNRISGIRDSMASGYNPYASVYGPQIVTVTYGGKTTTFQVSLDRFSDVPYGHRNYTHINALVGLGIINGYSDNTFRPNNTLTRAQAAIMIVRAIGLSTEGVSSNFTDVLPSHAAYKFISAAYQAGIINGYSDGTFRPNANVTRAQIAIMVQRAFNVQASGIVVSFTDVPEGYAPKKFIEILASQKIVNGYSDGTFKPLNNVTRAQFSTMIYNAIQYAKNN